MNLKDIKKEVGIVNRQLTMVKAKIFLALHGKNIMLIMACVFVSVISLWLINKGLDREVERGKAEQRSWNQQGYDVNMPAD